MCAQSYFYLGWPSGSDGFEAPRPRTSFDICGQELVLVIVICELNLAIVRYELVPVWTKHVASARPIVCRAVACPLVRTDGRPTGRTCNDNVLSRHDLENLIP